MTSGKYMNYMNGWPGGTGEGLGWYSKYWETCQYKQQACAQEQKAYAANLSSPGQYIVYPVTSSVTGGLAYYPYQVTVTASSNQTLTVNWVETLTGGLGQQNVYQGAAWPCYAAVETPEQRAESAKKYAELEAKRKAASLRAENLLFTILSPTQVRQYTDDGYFEADVNGRIYRLYANSRSRNVALVEAGKEKFKFCAHPSDAYDVPIADVLVSQLLMLRANEAEFLKVANRTVL